MNRKILQVGSSAGITIPTNALQALGVSVGDSVELVLNAVKKTISIQPITKTKESRREKITALTLDFVDRYREDLEALAD